MENRFKTRISRMFGKPFGSSCRTRNLSSDVVEKAVFLPHRQQHISNDGSGSCRLISPVSPPKKNRPFPTTICSRATCPEAASTRVINHCTVSASSVRRRSRQGVKSGRLVPAASPVSPLTQSYYEKIQSTRKQGKNNNNKKKKQSISQRRESSSLFSSSSLDSAYFGGSYYWFSTSDEKEEDGELNGYENDDESDTQFFSSRSFSSSDSSTVSALKNQSSGNTAGKKGKSEDEEIGVLQKVKGSFAVVKSSSDPYNDFRKSMVEMIVEKQIFGAKDLEQLLQCFLSLNADRHHRIIVEVFTEIWETLFSNWSFD